MLYEVITRCTMVQYKNSIVAALDKADNELTITAALLGSDAKSVKKRPSIIKVGAPGGCPTSSLNELVMNSPQSHQLAVGSMVKK